MRRPLTTRRARVLLATLAAAGLTVAGCGSDDEAATTTAKAAMRTSVIHQGAGTVSTYWSGNQSAAPRAATRVSFIPLEVPANARERQCRGQRMRVLRIILSPDSIPLTYSS